MVRIVGFEPTRLLPTDFKSASSASSDIFACKEGRLKAYLLKGMKDYASCTKSPSGENSGSPYLGLNEIFVNS